MTKHADCCFGEKPVKVSWTMKTSTLAFLRHAHFVLGLAWLGDPYSEATETPSHSLSQAYATSADEDRFVGRQVVLSLELAVSDEYRQISSALRTTARDPVISSSALDVNYSFGTSLKLAFADTVEGA